jgi:hypothetical protein
MKVSFRDFPLYMKDYDEIGVLNCSASSFRFSFPSDNLFLQVTFDASMYLIIFHLDSNTSHLGRREKADAEANRLTFDN